MFNITWGNLSAFVGPSSSVFPAARRSVRGALHVLAQDLRHGADDAARGGAHLGGRVVEAVGGIRYGVHGQVVPGIAERVELEGFAGEAELVEKLQDA